ncbi:MAG: cell division protein FtsZ, partial [Thermoplasmatales archaeon]
LQNQRNFVSPDDEELARIVESLKVNIKIVGCGGAGSNTINRCAKSGIYGADLIAMNTDAPHLLTIQANRKLLVGKRTTGGRGAGALPQVGEEAARESYDEIVSLIGNSEIVFITSGMGGGTGTGVAPVVAEAAKRQKSLVISIVTLPFSAEGRVRMDNALYGIEKLRKVSDTTIVIPNDKLLEIVPRLPLDQAFKVADEILMESLKGLTEIITKPGLVNLDYSDIQTVMKEGGVAMIGIGESVGGKASVEEAVTEAITSPLIEADISTTKGALVRIVGGEDMSVSQAEMAVRLIQERINPMARIVWGASVDPNLKGEFKVLVVLTGVNSPYFLSSTKGVAIKGARGLDAEVDSVM